MGWIRNFFSKKEKIPDNLPNLDEPFPENTDLEEKPAFQEMTGMTRISLDLPSHLEENPPLAPASSSLGRKSDLEMIHSKLDMLKSILNSMDQRISNLEQAAGIPQKKMPW